MTTLRPTQITIAPAHSGEQFCGCYVCGSGRFEQLELPQSDGRSEVVGICSLCGHGARLRQADPGANLARQLRYFDEHLAAPAPQCRRWPHRYALLRRQLERFGIRAGDVLDIGCGNGTWLCSLGGGWRKFGVELSPATARVARLHTGAEIHCGPIEEYQPPAAGFNLITAFALIEHLSDPRWLVRWCRRHLKPGGCLLLMTGDRESRTALAMGSEWPLYHPAEHLHFFSADSLTRLLASEQFEIGRCEWRYMPWGSSSLCRHLLMKGREVAGAVTQPTHDHLYLFARSPSSVEPGFACEKESR